MLAGKKVALTDGAEFRGIRGGDAPTIVWFFHPLLAIGKWSNETALLFASSPRRGVPFGEQVRGTPHPHRCP